METGIYVALSGQLALQRRLDTIANNVANSTTPGFRAENVTFETVLSQTQNSSVAYSGTGESTFSRMSGAITQTGNPLDVAIQGDAFLSVSGANGPVYTRDGRMRISTQGDLENMNGQQVLDQSGGPIQINPAKGAIQISRDGTISQNGERVGRLGLFQIPANAKLTRHEGASVIPDQPAEPVVDFVNKGFAQGYIEQANVNPVMEMTRLISVTRAFEAMTAAGEQSDRKLTDAIKTLGTGR
ncbi:MAG TPA: flagellar basal-body rod protein FlgF [Hyphomicrobiaceae bacterium]|nr:flagellar basal-body rod protein FlgF [Hyphomicrobiaceae bacterium]